MTVLNLDQILEKIEGLNSNLHLLEQMEITNERAAQKKKEEILNRNVKSSGKICSILIDSW